MRRVMRHLDERVVQFETKPLFQFLRDTSIDARRRLAFAPGVAHFVMSFADLYALVLREEPAKDPYQELVNAHVQEDANHWRWFLADLDKLGFDPQMAFTDALKFVWSDVTQRTRLLTYDMCRLGYRADSLSKLVLVHCIEAAGKVTVKHVASAGGEFATASGKRLVYLGPHHLATESDHTLEEDAVRRSVEAIEIDADRARRFISVVDEAFDSFGGFVDDMLALAKSGLPFP
jgi:hypothetical protein